MCKVLFVMLLNFNWLYCIYAFVRSLAHPFAHTICCISQNSTSVIRIPFVEYCTLLLSIRSTVFIHIWPTDLFSFIVAMSQRFILFTRAIVCVHMYFFVVYACSKYVGSLSLAFARWNYIITHRSHTQHVHSIQ